IFAGQELLVDVGEDRTAGLLVDPGRPVDLHVGVGGDRFAVGAVQHIHEAVLVGLDHHLAGLATNLEIGEHLFVGGVDVVDVVGRILIVADNLPGFRPDRQQAGGVEAVAFPARPRIVRLRVAGAPVDEVELGIIGARAPGRPAAARPGVAVLRPGLRAGLAGRRNSVPPPQFLAGLGVPAVKEAARRRFPARHPGNQYAVGDDGGAGCVIALLRFGELLLPDLLAGLHVEGDDVVVDRHAKELAVVKHRRAARDAAAVDAGFGLNGRAPELPAGLD